MNKLFLTLSYFVLVFAAIVGVLSLDIILPMAGVALSFLFLILYFLGTVPKFKSKPWHKYVKRFKF